MSWSLEYIAENKKAAHEHLGTQYAPDAVKDFIILALDGLTDDGLISVKSQGHLAQGAGSYQVTTCTAEIKRIHIQVTAAKPATEELDSILRSEDKS